MSGEIIRVGIDEIAAARALVAIKGEEQVSPTVAAALARVRPGHPVHVDQAGIDEGEPVESAS